MRRGLVVISVPLCLGMILVVATPTPAATIYDSGPPSLGAGGIVGAAMSDSVTSAGHFTLANSATIQGIAFASADQASASPTVAWAILADAGGQVGAVLDSGTATSVRTTIIPGGSFTVGSALYSYDTGGFSIPATTLAAGSYFLALQDSGDPGFLNGGYARDWAANAATSTNYIGQMIGTGGWTTFSTSGVSFQLLETPFSSGSIASVPEPASIVMSGIAAIVGLGYAWRKRRRPSVAA